MIDPPEPGDAQVRRHLTGVAYRLLGTITEAEDAVQETYARWYALTPSQRDAIDSPAAWLTTVVGRICLDVLKSARVRRETYVGPWLPEPVLDEALLVRGRAARTRQTPSPWTSRSAWRC